MRASELSSDLQALRANLAEELHAVNRYEPLIESLAHEDARAAVARITDARKSHVALLVAAIEQLDPTQREANARQAGGRGA